MKNPIAKANPISLHHNINLPYNSNPNPTNCKNHRPNDPCYNKCHKEWENKGCVCGENRADAIANTDNWTELLKGFQKCTDEFHQCYSECSSKGAEYNLIGW